MKISLDDRPTLRRPNQVPWEVPDLVPWLVSGHGAEELGARAGKLLEHIAARPGLAAVDVGLSLATASSMREHRAVVIGTDTEELLAGLAAVAAREPAANVVTGRAGVAPRAADRGRVAFVFPGQGSQWPGMGRELAGCAPVFARRLAECGRALEPYVNWSLDAVLAADENAPWLERVDVVQPALWAIMISLAAVWESAGVIPDAVVGHSQGEIAAACVGGALSLEDGARVVALRSQALTRLAGNGGMLSIAMPAGDVRELLAGEEGRLSVAAVNGPAATVVSGENGALAELEAACPTGTRTRRIPVDYASHSLQVERIQARILGALEPITPRPARVRLVSGMTGLVLDGPEVDAGYWYASLRQPVEFDRAIRGLADAGHHVFVEVSPHPVLAGGIAEILWQAAAGVPTVATGTLRRGHGGARRFLTSAARLHVHGAEVGWAAIFQAAGGRLVDLPT